MFTTPQQKSPEELISVAVARQSSHHAVSVYR
jgi:hypothetical protein